MVDWVQSRITEYFELNLSEELHLPPALSGLREGRTLFFGYLADMEEL